MKLLKNILIIAPFIFIFSLSARPMGGARAQQPSPAPAPIAVPSPPAPAQPVPQPSQQPAPAKKSFNTLLTEIRTQWKQHDVINAHGSFTPKFINFVVSANLDSLMTQTLLEAGKNLYLPLSNNTVQNQQSLHAADTMIKHSLLDQKYPFYNARAKLFKQNHIDEAVRGFAATNPSVSALDTFTNTMLKRLNDHWNTIGEHNTASLIPQAQKQIDDSFEKYGLIKRVIPLAIPQPKPAPQPVQPPAQPPVQPAAPQPAPQPVNPAQQAKGPISLKIGTTTIKIIQGDLLNQKVDAIVNAANDELQHGGGIAGKISNAAGPQLQAYCNTMPNYPGYTTKCPTGKAVLTPSFNLVAKDIKNIIHATGPLGSDANREQLLTDAYTNSLKVAQQYGIKSIAFPAISTAIFGYPIDQATPVAFAAVRNFLEQNPNVFNEVRFILWSDIDFAVYAKLVVDL